MSGGLITNATGENDGGAIRATGSASLTLAGVTLTGNRVIRTDQSPALGGAVSFVRGALTVMNTAVLNNSATSSGPEFGGGIARGGGIYIDDNSSTLIFPTFVDVTFQGNRAGADGGAGGDARGGGLFFEGLGVLSVTRGTFRTNSATANGTSEPGGVGWGGALFFQGDEGSAMLQLARVIVQENLASATTIGNNGGNAAGGGVYVSAAVGVLGIRDSTFSQNLVTANANNGADGGIGQGGAIFVIASSHDNIVISRTGIAQNTVLANGGTGAGGSGGTGQGGGIFFQAQVADLTLSDVTVSGNSTAANAVTAAGGIAQGGGAYFSSNGTLALVNTTVSTNSVAAAGTSAGAAQGGGVFLASAGTIQNSIFSDNTATAGPNCSGSSVTSLGNNLFANGGSCGASGTDKVGVSAGLGSLADTGQPGGLHRPLAAGSEAIDGANPAACPVIDQLGRGRVGVCDIGAAEFVPGGPALTTLVAAVLPASRAGVTGSTVTAFVTVINAGAVPAYQVGIGLASGSSPALLGYQTTDPNTNLPTGLANTPVDIAPGNAQTYVIAVLLTGAFDPTDLVLVFAGTNTLAVPAVVGLNTFLASASTTSIPDVVALAATIGNTGIVDVAPPSNAGAFSVATVNLGAADTIAAVSNTGGATLPLAIFICETDPSSTCKAPPAVSVSIPIATNATPTFAVFATGLGSVPFDPANNRIFVLFVDSGGRVRGGTSVAVRTTP